MASAVRLPGQAERQPAAQSGGHARLAGHAQWIMGLQIRGGCRSQSVVGSDMVVTHTAADLRRCGRSGGTCRGKREWAICVRPADIAAVIQAGIAHGVGA